MMASYHWFHSVSILPPYLSSFLRLLDHVTSLDHVVVHQIYLTDGNQLVVRLALPGRINRAHFLDPSVATPVSSAGGTGADDKAVTDESGGEAVERGVSAECSSSGHAIAICETPAGGGGGAGGLLVVFDAASGAEVNEVCGGKILQLSYS